MDRVLKDIPSIPSSRFCREMIVDQKTGRVRKRYDLLEGSQSGFSPSLIPDDFKREIGGSIRWLERNGFKKFLPSPDLSIVDDRSRVRGFTCWMEEDWIDGLPLVDNYPLDQSIAIQLGEFLDLCRTGVGSRNNRLVLPDIRRSASSS